MTLYVVALNLNSVLILGECCIVKVVPGGRAVHVVFGIGREMESLTLLHSVLRSEAQQVKSTARDVGFGIEMGCCSFKCAVW